MAQQMVIPVGMPANTQAQQQYQLSEEDRQSILSNSQAGRRTLLIEKQREAFIQLHGDPFGAELA